MNNLEKYIHNTIGQNFLTEPLPEYKGAQLPIYVRESYHFYEAALYDKTIILAEPKDHHAHKLIQIEKHILLLEKNLHQLVVLLVPELAAYKRKKLIEKKVNFIVPGKQMYLPSLFLDLQENFKMSTAPTQATKLLPSAQFLVIYHITQGHNNLKLEDKTLKEVAKILGYTPMAISKAVENLKQLDVIDIIGEKEKWIRFKKEKLEIWNDLLKRNLFVDPVLKRIYVDALPREPFRYANYTALPEYSDLNPSTQIYVAIDKNIFYQLQKKNVFENANDDDGLYCIEVWKYDPVRLAANIQNKTNVVDPLSLYLSIKDNKDERVEMALEQLLKNNIW